VIRPIGAQARISQLWGANPSYYQRFGVPYHNGTDYAAPMYTQLLCVADGEVAYFGVDPRGYGNYVRIWHPELSLFSFYAHMSDLTLVNEMGKLFREGDPVGSVGNTGNSTGPHLHFEIRLAIDRWKYAVSPYANMSRGRINPETLYRLQKRFVEVD
jgi:murein DD-endopeptidase MepM/ murein hydrolase activator NlpD